jgi:formylglycine-generating enzyme required for sulfatase activity
MKKLAVLVILASLAVFGCVRDINHNMARIQGGTFVMGSPGGEAERDIDERRHNVTISPFYMGKYEVTQNEYQSIMKDTPSNFKGSKRPVESVSWYNAILFCNKLSEKRGLTPVYAIDGTSVGWDKNANGYRLPTEAEWEYACRAGTDTPFNTGMNITTEQANYDGNWPYNNNAQGAFLERTLPVGSFPANPWGLYDMHGNVYEWCWDWHATYSREDQTNPTGPASGSYHVIRGGSWVNSGYALRSASRGVYLTADGNERIGFRIARNAD